MTTQAKHSITDITFEALDQHETVKQTPPVDPRGLLDITPVSVGSWPDGLQLMSRDEYYDDNDPDSR